MGPAVDALLFTIGAAMVLAAMVSAVKATVLPRAVQNRLVTLVVVSMHVSMRLIFRMLSRRNPTYERQDRVMAFFGPVTLVAELATWIALLVVGYSLMFLGIETSSVKRAVELSGSSVTTIGSVESPHLIAQLLTYS